MKISSVVFGVCFPVAVCTEACSTSGRRERSLAGRYRPSRTSFCADCPPQHRHLLLVDFGISDKLRNCSSTESIEAASQLKALRWHLHPETILVVMSGMRNAASVMTVMAEKLSNVTFLSYNSSEVLSRACRALRGICYRLDNLLPVIAQIRGSPSEGTRPASGSDVISAADMSDEFVRELCRRPHARNRLVEVTASFSGLEPSAATLTLDDLLPSDPKSYDKNRAPKVGGKATVVNFHVTVLSLDSINEEAMTYVADIFLAQSWRDPRLRLPENMREDYRILDVDWLREIWRPDSFFKNAKKVTFHEMSIPNHYLWLYHDKTLLYMSKLTLVLSCAMKFESFPHDTQICLMMMESLSHTVRDLVFIWNSTDPLIVSPNIELPQLDISETHTADCSIEYSTGKFSCLAVVFNLRRRLGYHLLHTYIPSALIVVMSWISFWIKPEAIPARVTLGVTSLLTLATQNTQSQKSLPPVSYVKAIDVWMSSCSVFVFLSLMEFAVVNSYMEPGGAFAENPGAPRWMRSRGREVAQHIDRFSRFFFPFSFVVLNIVYWSTFL